MKNIFVCLFIALPICLSAQRPNMGGDFRKGNASQHIGVISGKLVDAEDGSLFLLRMFVCFVSTMFC